MYCIGVDYDKRYSHLAVLDAQGQVLKTGTVSNTAEAVETLAMQGSHVAQVSDKGALTRTQR